MEQVHVRSLPAARVVKHERFFEPAHLVENFGFLVRS